MTDLDLKALRERAERVRRRPQSFDSWWPYDPIQLEGDDEDAATTKDIAESAWDEAWEAAECDVLAREQGRWEVVAAEQEQMSTEIDALKVQLAAADALAEAVQEMRKAFYIKTHPGEECLQSGHVRLTTIDRWDAALARYLEARKSE